MFQHPSRRPSSRTTPLTERVPAKASAGEMNRRPVCGLFPAYSSREGNVSPELVAAGDAKSGSPANAALTPGAQARSDRARRRLQEVMYIEALPRMGAHPVRQMAVFSPLAPPTPFAQMPGAYPRASAPSPRAASRTTGSRRAHGGPLRWAEEPLFVGLGLLLFFPLGIALLWASPRFSRDARLAITAFTGFVLALGALMVIARA